MNLLSRIYALSQDPDVLAVLFFVSICLTLLSHSLGVLSN